MRKFIAITTALLALSAAAFAQTRASREIPKDGTKVNLFFGGKRIPAVLNGSTTARGFYSSPVSAFIASSRAFHSRAFSSLRIGFSGWSLE